MWEITFLLGPFTRKVSGKFKSKTEEGVKKEFKNWYLEEITITKVEKL